MLVATCGGWAARGAGWGDAVAIETGGARALPFCVHGTDGTSCLRVPCEEADGIGEADLAWDLDAALSSTRGSKSQDGMPADDPVPVGTTAPGEGVGDVAVADPLILDSRRAA